MAAIGKVGAREPAATADEVGRMTAKRFCECENPHVQVEDGVGHCHDCGHELKPAPPPDPVDLIAERLFEKLADRLASLDVSRGSV